MVLYTTVFHVVPLLTFHNSIFPSIIPSAFCLDHEWSEYVKYVVTELESKPDNGITAQRQELLRGKIKEVIPCNIRDNSILGERTIEKFDIVQTNLCLEVACESKEEFTKCVGGLKTLLKPGGYLVFLTAKGGSWYTCAGSGCKLHQLKMEEEDILEAVKQSGKGLGILLNWVGFEIGQSWHG